MFIAVIVAAAMVLGYVMFSDDVRKAREACLARGGQIVIESDGQSVGLPHFCLLPNGERERL